VSPGGNADVYARSGDAYTPLTALETGPATSVAAADLDADGDRDLAFGREAADLVLANQSSAAPLFGELDRLGDSQSVAVLMADFDIDGRIDVVSIGAAGAHRLYANDGAQPPRLLAHGGGFSGRAASGAAVGLLDAGGVPDVAVVGSNVVAIFLNIGGPDSGGTLGAPSLTLNGASTMIVTIGEQYQDPGASAIDAADGDLTGQILVDNPVDTNVIGRYSVTYEVVDSAGNLATATRIVEVKARPPVGGGGGGAAGLALLLLAGGASFARSRRDWTLATPRGARTECFIRS
jgi:hypothetical protein